MNKNKVSLILVLFVALFLVHNEASAQQQSSLFLPRYELNLKIAEVEVCNLLTDICAFQVIDDRTTHLLEFGKKTAKGQVVFNETNETQKKALVGGRATLFNGEAQFIIFYKYALEEPEGTFIYEYHLDCIGSLTSKKRRMRGGCFGTFPTTISGTPSTVRVSGTYEALTTKRKPISAFK